MALDSTPSATIGCGTAVDEGAAMIGVWLLAMWCVGVPAVKMQ